MKNKPERRFLAAPEALIEVETREDGGSVLTGHASVFYREGDAGTEYKMWPGMIERVMPGAFDEALNDDVRGLFNHDPSLILGRRSAGTLRISVDETGLRYEIDLPDTQTGRDLPVSVSRGDITGSSYAFRVRGAEGHKIYKDKELNSYIREIRSVELFDVSPVTYPAYKGADVSARDEDSNMDLRAIIEKLESEEAETQGMAVNSIRRQRLNLSELGI